MESSGFANRESGGAESAGIYRLDGLDPPGLVGVGRGGEYLYMDERVRRYQG